jgi:beta-glucosidase
MQKIQTLSGLVILAGWLAAPALSATHPDSNSVDPQVEARVNELVGQMTLEEKTQFLYGADFMNLHGFERLGIPPLTLADGPLGIRWGTSTAFPASIALGSTWDVDLAHRLGTAMGKEWRNKGRRVWLGPCVGLVRVPHGGRNFESYGEDPHLNARLAVATISGAQSQGLIACVKHYALNNQDLQRFTIDIKVDERTMHELYLPVFEAAVKEAGVWSVMSAYNKVNGPYCTASHDLQNEVLKNRWGFRGFVVSDWGAVHDTVEPANAGLDLEMDLDNPVGKHWGHGKLLEAVNKGLVSQQALDDKVRRLLRAMASVGALDDHWQPLNKDLPESVEIARQIARDGIVLLKNDRQVLPLDPQKKQTIAVIGPNHQEARTGGGGSSLVVPPYAISPLEGLKAAAGSEVKFISAVGVYPAGIAPKPVPSAWLRTPNGKQNGMLGEYFANRDLEGDPVLTRVDETVGFRWGNDSPGEGVPQDRFSVRWTGTLTVPESGEFLLGFASDDGARFKLDGRMLFEDWGDHAIVLNERHVQLEAGRAYPIEIEYYDNSQSADAILSCRQQVSELDEALAAAREADVALVCVGLSLGVEGEGADRPSMDLDDEQIELINQVAEINPNTIVCVIAGSQVGMHPWVDQVPAVMQAWYGGQEAGHGIADIVFGKHSPSGKLPMTFVRHWEDHPCADHYPGNEYREGLFMGYRHFDRSGTEPLFPFGHGLSYTTFELGNLKLNSCQDGGVDVEVDVTNTGRRAGAEVVQCYVHDPECGVLMPEQQLAAFAKVWLEPGSTTTVKMTIRPRSFQYYDSNDEIWRHEPGEFEIRVGTSSRNLPLKRLVVPNPTGGMN